MKRIFTKQKIVLVMSSLFLCMVLLEIGLRIGGFILLSLQENRNRISIKQRGTYRIMCVGESMTFHQWPHLLEQLLNQRDIGIKFSVIDKARPGINTVTIVSQLEDNLNKYNPDMVIAMMGINDGWISAVYKNTAGKKMALFLKSLRIYKLAQLLQLHTINKAQELGIYKPKKRKEDISNSAQLNSFRSQGDYDRARRMLEKAIEVNPENDRAGRYYKDQGDYDRVRRILEKAIEVNPENDRAYVWLGRYYKDQGDYDRAREMLEKAIEINPENDRAYVWLGWYYRVQGDYDRAKGMLEKAIEINPENYWAYVELGWYYKDQGDYDRARGMLEKAIEVNPENDRAYVELGGYYRVQGDYDRARRMLEKAIEVNPENDRAYGALTYYYQELGRYKLAEESFRNSIRLRSQYYNSMTQYNYQKLKVILAKRGIKLVCVQYPVRSVEPLKKMLEPHEGTIFVDNETVFKKALKQASHDEYFTDMFAGDFGHCTPKANRLLAENIAEVILKQCFDK